MSKFGSVCAFGAICALWAGVMICDKNIKMIHEKQNEIIDEISKLQDHARASATLHEMHTRHDAEQDLVLETMKK